MPFKNSKMIPAQDQLAPLMRLGLYRSVNLLVSFEPRPSTRILIIRARALTDLQKYHAAIKVLDSIDRNNRTEDEINEILELRFTCYFNLPNAATKCQSLLPYIHNRILTPKLHVLAAKAYMLQEDFHSQNHPAIPHLLEVLKLYPMAIELIEDLLFVGAPIQEILALIPPGYARAYVESLQHTAKSEFTKAIQILSTNPISTDPLPICFLNQICVNAWQSGQMEVFDQNSQLIPDDDLEIVDLRAARLKNKRRGEDLNQLVLFALNIDENNANCWLAFSHLLELNKDHQRALQTTRKALLLDRTSRRGLMRHGELRMQRNDTKKALTAFLKAHQIHPGLDSYSEIVKCNCILEDYQMAESFAAKALLAYPLESEHSAVSITLMGLALKMREPQRACELLQKALKIKPDYDEPLNALVDMKIKEDDLDGAEALLREYREQSHDFFFWLKLGEIYGYKRDFQKALEFVTTASRLEPENERAREMLGQLEEMIRENESDLDTEEDNSY